MAVRQIITIPDARLTLKCEKVKEITDEVKKNIQDLMDTLKVAKNPEGAGLAASQLGIMKRICVVKNFFQDPADASKTISEEIVLINPKIISTSKETQVDWEGCLSVPDMYGKVERYSKVKVQAQDLEGNDIRLKATGYLAAVIQHEVDHLDGILFTDRIIGKQYTGKELKEFFGVEY